MTNIAITEVTEDLKLEFVQDSPNTKRLWIRDPKAWFQTVGRFCPHLHFIGMECSDCALNVE